MPGTCVTFRLCDRVTVCHTPGVPERAASYSWTKSSGVTLAMPGTAPSAPKMSPSAMRSSGPTRRAKSSL
eukprot:8421062-Pyramimonas_sp.AAC.1